MNEASGALAVFLSIAIVGAPQVASATTFVSDTDFARSGHFRYYGSWEHVRHLHDGRFFDSSSRSASPGAVLTFTFVGRVVRIYGVRGPGGGDGVVSIDGKRYPDVSFFAASKQTRAIIFRSPIMPEGHHIVAIAAEGDPRDARHRSSYVNVSGASFE